MTQASIPPVYDTTWRNDDQAQQDAAGILRLAHTGPDYERLGICARAAGNSIGAYLDRTEPIPGVVVGEPPDDLRFSHAHVTVELYRRKDAPFGVLDAWSPDSGAARIGNDPLAGVKVLLLPYKARWGVS